MKKAILISIRPEWVEKILNGEKTIEIRRNMPKCDLPIDVYIYCSKGDVNLIKENITYNIPVDFDRVRNYYQQDKVQLFHLDTIEKNDEFHDKYMRESFEERNVIGEHWGKEEILRSLETYIRDYNSTILNGKVVAKFTLNKVEWVACEDLGYRKIFFTQTREDFSYVAEMTDDQLSAYFLNKELKQGNVVGYAWHIENLQIFDKPMELNQFEKYYDEPDDLKPCCNGKHCIHKIYDWCENQICCEIDYDGTDCPYLKVNKAPQSWKYVYIGD